MSGRIEAESTVQQETVPQFPRTRNLKYLALSLPPSHVLERIISDIVQSSRLKSLQIVELSFVDLTRTQQQLGRWACSHGVLKHMHLLSVKGLDVSELLQWKWKCSRLSTFVCISSQMDAEIELRKVKQMIFGDDREAHAGFHHQFHAFILGACEWQHPCYSAIRSRLRPSWR